MMNRAILAGTLAGILSGMTYLSTPSTAQEPPARPSTAPSAYALEDIAKLQEKMRDVVHRSFEYKSVFGEAKDSEGTFLFYNYSPTNFFPKRIQETDRIDQGMPPFDILVKYFSFNSVPLLCLLLPEGMESINSEGKFIRYDKSIYSNFNKFVSVIVNAYEGTQKRCQEGAIGLKTSVRVKGDITSIQNIKAKVEIKNQMYEKASIAAQILLNGSAKTNRKLLKIGEQHFIDGKPTGNEQFILSVDGLELIVIDARAFQW